MTLPQPGLELYPGRDDAGRDTEWWWRDQRELMLPGSRLSTWEVEGRDGRRLICRRLPAAAGAGAGFADQLLDNEIRAMSRLATRYGRGDYPPELPRLMGYHFDTIEPYVLCVPFRGSCADQGVRNLLSDQRMAFAVGLLRALAQLAAVDLVHGAVGLSTTWWDGSRVQLVNFECAAAIGEPRRLADHSAWASPDQIRGTGRAHPGDDVFSAGLVIYELFTGTRPTGVRPPQVTGRGALLSELLAGVFRPEAQHRPAAAELLGRLSMDGNLPVPMDVDASLQAGRTRFDKARRTKHPLLDEGHPPVPPAEPVEPTPGEPPGPPMPSVRRTGTSTTRVTIVGALLTVFV
ncbi:MAG: hypothetical protein ACRDSN_10825, partial [Pseudonocardiaceae bacterium]